MTQRGLATGVVRWFGRDLVLDFADWAEFTRRDEQEHAEVTRQHTFRSITASIAHAREMLGYAHGIMDRNPARVVGWQRDYAA